MLSNFFENPIIACAWRVLYGLIHTLLLGSTHQVWWMNNGNIVLLWNLTPQSVWYGLWGVLPIAGGTATFLGSLLHFNSACSSWTLIALISLLYL